MNVLQLDDLVYSYPSIKNENFQNLLSSKWEFQEVSAPRFESRPPRGHPYKHQELLKRFILVYDRLLVNHRTGTGKTCGGFGAAEILRKGMINAVADFINIYVKPQRTNIKRIYWLTSGTVLKKETRKELLCKCSEPGPPPLGYDITPIDKAETAKSRESQITKAIKPYYVIETYGKFMGQNFVAKYTIPGTKNIDLNKLKEDFSDCLFIIDEVQYMHPNLNEASGNQAKTKKQHYKILWAIFHLAERTKVMMLTATPMVNSAKEISTVMNLILPENKQMEDDLDLDSITLEEIEEYFRGYVSFVREADTGAVPRIIGEHLINKETGDPYVYNIGGNDYKSSIIYYGTTMSPFHQNIYEKNINKHKDAYKSASRQLATFVFPDGSYGKTGANKYLTKSKQESFDLNPKYKQDLIGFLASTEGIGILSCKFAETIRLCRDGLMYGEIVFIPNSGFYEVIDKPSIHEVTLRNVGGAGSLDDFGRQVMDFATQGQTLPRFLPIVYGGQVRKDGAKDKLFGDPDIFVIGTNISVFEQPDIGGVVHVIIHNLQIFVDQMKERPADQQIIYLSNVGFYEFQGVVDKKERIVALVYVSPDTNNPVEEGVEVPAYLAILHAAVVPGEDDTVSYVPQRFRPGVWITTDFIQPERREEITLNVNSSKSSGSVFCYNDFKESGAYLLGFCFSYQGFEQFSDTTQAFRSVKGAQMAPFCISDVDQTREIVIEKKPRFAVLTPRTKSVVLELFNSQENLHGDYIKVLIGSPVTKAGISLENCLQFHMIGPPWNFTNMYQAMSRVFRATSHISLVAEKERELILERAEAGIENPEDVDPNDIKIDVNVYLHCAVTTKEDVNSVDVGLYKKIEEKDIPIRRIERFIKQCSIDCKLHRNRNVRPDTDIDGSPICDYAKCNYKCFGDKLVDKGIVEPLETDFSSFNVLYSNDLIKGINSQIDHEFTNSSSFSIDSLVQILILKYPEFYQPYPNPKFYITQAIETLIKNKAAITNRFGQLSYVKETAGQIFLVRDYPVLNNEIYPNLDETYLSNASLAIYSEGLFAVGQNKMEDFSSDIYKEGYMTRIENIIRMTDSDQVIEILDNELSTVNTDVDFLSDLLETATTTLVDGDLPPARATIVNYFCRQHLLYRFNEPRAYILHTRGIDEEGNPLPPPRRGRGRPKKNPLPFDAATAPDILQDPDADVVYVHRILTDRAMNVRYARKQKAMKLEGDLRLLNISEGWNEWITIKEIGPQLAYRGLIIRKLEGGEYRFEDKFKVYGIMLPPENKFLIRDIRRGPSTGGDCMTKYNKDGIAGWIDVASYLGIMPPNAVIRPKLTKDQVIKLLTDKHYKFMTDESIFDELEIAYYWYQYPHPKQQMCNLIQEFLEDNNMIYRGGDDNEDDEDDCNLEEEGEGGEGGEGEGGEGEGADVGDDEENQK